MYSRLTSISIDESMIPIFWISAPALYFQTVHFKVHDPSRHCKGSSRENTITKYNSHGPPLPRGFPKRWLYKYKYNDKYIYKDTDKY